MKKLLLSLAAFAMAAGVANATEVTIDFTSFDAGNVDGEYFATEYKDDGSVKSYARYQPVNSFSDQGFTLTFSQADGQTAPALYDSKAGTWDLRLYNGNSMTVASNDGSTFNKIVFTVKSGGKFNLTAEAGNLVETEWTISEGVSSATFTGAGTSNIIAVTISSGEGGEVEPPTTSTIYSTSFKADGQGAWTIEDTVLPSELSYIWSYDDRYGMKASAYLSGAAYDAESYLISPAFDLKDYSSVTLTFTQALNYFESVAKAKEEATVWARENNGAWQQVNVAGFPESLSWTFVEATANLSNFAGKSNVQVAFRYNSTAAKSGTWEINEVSLAGDKSTGVNNMAVENAPVEYFNLQGVRVNNPQAGQLLIVRQGNKTFKAVIR